MTRRNLEMYRGDTKAFCVIVKNNGVVVDITNYNIQMTAKYSQSDADNSAVFTVTYPGDIQLTDPTNGEMLVRILPAKTSGLSSGQTYRLYYDIQLSSGSTVVYTVVSGILTIYSDVSITAA
jgi:hypothetical protein